MRTAEIIKNPRLVSIDSRAIKKGGVFVAIKGARFDGHDFVKEAFGRGAALAVVSKNVKVAPGYKNRLIRVRDTVAALGEMAKAHRIKFKIPVVAITGSNGKTTAKDMASFVLSSKYRVLANERSENNLIGLPLTLLKLGRGHRIAILEMGMNHAGEIGKLTEIAMPRVGVITNIGPSHLEFLGTLKNVFAAKSELLKGLPGGGTAILNKDDAYLSRAGGLKCGRVYFGIERKCLFKAKDLCYKGNKWFFSVAGGGTFSLPLPGRHNIYNALVAIALARQFGIGFRAIRRRLGLFREAPSMRLEVKNIRGLKILDDSYNSNPASMRCAIDTLAGYATGGKRIIVSGDMMELGKGAKALHEEVGGAIAKSPIDALITLGRLSRFTRRGARRNGMRELHHAKSHLEAANLLKNTAKRGDVVLLKGSRAMEMEKIIEKLK
jgi:UDP-N-acetylmuramoyl-tripeptide--D-alanyl-D-alanine ligase